MNIEIFLLLKDAGSRNKEKQRKIEGLRPREGSRGFFFSLSKLDTEKPSMIHQADMSGENSRGGTRGVIFSIGF